MTWCNCSGSRWEAAAWEEAGVECEAASGAGGEDGGGAAMSRARFAAALLRAAQDPVVIDQAFAQYQEFVKGQEAEVEVEMEE